MFRRVLALSVLALAACSPATTDAPTPAATGVDTAGMDKSVKPGDDFFAYANGAWSKATEIPADRSSWGGNGILAEKVDKDVADLIKDASAGKPATGTTRTSTARTRRLREEHDHRRRADGWRHPGRVGG